MRITQKDIAKNLDVSLITVSRALTGTGYVSNEMKRRILDFARQKNYVPHKASQVLVRNRIHRLALFSSSLPTYFWDDIRRGIDAAANQIRPFDFDVQYHMVAESDTDAYIALIKNEIRAGVAALGIVNQPIYDMDAIFAVVDAAGIPYVTFNVDAPDRRRLCYIGADYMAGGRLAAEVIGTAFRLRGDGTVLVIADSETERRDPAHVCLNADRLDGFLDVIHSRFPSVRCDVQYVEPELRPDLAGDQIGSLLRAKKRLIHAVYLIPAVNPAFLDALEKTDYRDTINIVHDLDSSAMNHLDTHLLTAAIHQNPILQGYYAVKTLEHIVESKTKTPMQDIEIVSDVIFAENKNISRNHFTMIR